MPTDETIKTLVQAELIWEPSITAAHIGVTSDDGVLTLSGHVGSFGQKHAAEAAARRVKGVKAVVERIEVRLPFESQRDDEQIAAAAADRLAWDTVVPDTVKATVQRGRITLDGEVDAYFQRRAARNAVAGLFGVTGLSDKITIKPRIDATQLGDTIEHALHRSWFFDPAISVTADGGRIHLTGSVKSPHERQVAAMTAWAAPGATSVQNDIRVN
jgi:osmotically-inducible protein OsmY